jgi:hypothetical protein
MYSRSFCLYLQRFPSFRRQCARNFNAMCKAYGQNTVPQGRLSRAYDCRLRILLTTVLGTVSSGPALHIRILVDAHRRTFRRRKRKDHLGERLRCAPLRKRRMRTVLVVQEDSARQRRTQVIQRPNPEMLCNDNYSLTSTTIRI